LGEIEFSCIYEKTNGNEIMRKKKEMVKKTCDGLFGIKALGLVGKGE